MNIVRHILPDGMPLVVDSVLTDDGKRDSMRIYPVFPNGKVGEVIFTPPVPSDIKHEYSELGGIIDFLLDDNYEPDIQDDPEEDTRSC